VPATRLPAAVAGGLGGFEADGLCSVENSRYRFARNVAINILLSTIRD
jgi:hypothetical protein